jgi:hypothetical protein
MENIIYSYLMCSQAIDQNIFPKVLGTLELFPVPRKLYTEPFICTFRPDPLTNMAVTGNSCFSLVDLRKIFSETAWPNEPKPDRKHLWKVTDGEYNIQLFNV